MSNTPINVLLVEDNPGDARLIRELIVDTGDNSVQLECVDRLEVGLEHLATGVFDGLLLDLSLPDSQGIDTFCRVYEKAPEVPTIVLTGFDDEELAVRAVREGAQDYLVKGHVDGNLLLRSLRYAVERKKAESQIQNHYQRLSSLVKINRDIATLLDQETLLPRIADEARKIFKMDSASFRLIEGDNLVLKGSVGTKRSNSSRVRILGGVAERLVREGGILAIRNIMEDPSLPERRKQKVVQMGYRSILGAPLRVADRTIGIILLYSKEEKEFSPVDTTLLSSFADQAAIAIENARLYEETKKQATQLEQDIAQRKLAEGQLKEVNANLQRSHEELKATQIQLIQAAKLESVGRLAAGVAHEVKNPLEIILMSAEYLSKHLTDKDEQTTMLLDDIDYAVRRADSVVRGLLDYSATDEMKTHPEDLNSVIEGSLSLVKHQLDRAHVTLDKQLAGVLPSVNLDRNKLQQVFINLLMNAAHAMEGGGTVTVKTCKKELTETDFKECFRKPTTFEIGETAIIAEIEDTGKGISSDTLEKIFDPFFTTKPTGNGTGLGLTVVSKIIELHSGFIDLNNQEQGGIRARLIFKS